MKDESMKVTVKYWLLSLLQEFKNGSGGRTRTYNMSVNSRLLCQLSYAGTLDGAMFLKDNATAL
jgi:hypothetical protein